MKNVAGVVLIVGCLFLTSCQLILDLVTPKYSVIVQQATGGTISLTPSKSAYAAGSIVTVTATPAQGYAFASWSGSLSGAVNPATLTIEGDASIGAIFTFLSTDSADVATAKAAIDVGFGSGDSAASVKGDLILPVQASNGVSVVWSSVPSGVIGPTGLVTRPATGADAAVTLTATLSKGSASDTKVYQLTVKARPPFSLASPTGSVYIAPPSLTYTSSNTVTLTLNGSTIGTANGSYLVASATGLNHLVVTESDGQGYTASRNVDYFLSNLTQADSDAFSYPDAQTTSPTWNGWTIVSNLALPLKIDAGAIAAGGAASLYSWGVLLKGYSFAAETKFIEAQDIVALANQTAYTMTGLFGQPGETLAAQLVRTPAGLDLYLTETSPTKIASPNYVIFGQASLSAVSPGTAVRVYFYRNANSYQAVAADPSGTILASVYSPSYVSAVGSELVYRGIALAPYDTTSSTSIIVKVDNYSYYK